MQQWSEDAPASAAPASPAGFCDGCGATLPAGTRFCTSCGRPREGFCSWCNAPLPEDVRFCPSCGRPAVRDRVYGRGAVAGKPIAGFGFRAGVYLVDSIILSTIFGLALQIFAFLRMDRALDRLEALLDREQAGEIVTSGEYVDVFLPFILLYLGYFLAGMLLPWIWNSLGWSPAQRIIGLRIVDAEGRAPGWRRGLGRTAASWLSDLALGLGYLAAAWHPEKRTWHDRMAGTWVVDVRTDR